MDLPLVFLDFSPQVFHAVLDQTLGKFLERTGLLELGSKYPVDFSDNFCFLVGIEFPDLATALELPNGVHSKSFVLFQNFLSFRILHAVFFQFLEDLADIQHVELLLQKHWQLGVIERLFSLTCLGFNWSLLQRAVLGLTND